MGEERRWTASYQFLEELWRGRSRIIYDPELEGLLHAGGPESGPSAGLFDALLPRGDNNGRADGRVWMALDNDRLAASFARGRGGTVFVGLDAAGEVASEEPWEVALVNLGESLATGLSPAVEGMLELLGERSEDGRTVVIMIGCELLGEDGSYEQLADLVDELCGDGRIFGLARPAMAAFYDFGTVLESDAGSETDVGIEVDNSLGSEQPRFEGFVAVVGPRVPGEGVTLVELDESPATSPRASSAPAGPRSSSGSADAEDLAALRAQLAEAQRRGDTQAIERQDLLEKLEQAEDRIAALEDREEAWGEGGGEAEEDSPTIDAVLAREQALRWDNDRLRGELERLRARPVEALEAELATVRAQLETELALRAE
ncbi:MAG: hypothetical protein KC431_26375, partial [Myxococcales bacterium]|nr:hypothetical protein [Myxococcales bacterium]